MAENWWERVKSREKRLWTAVALVLGLVEKDGAPFQRQNLDDDETLALYVQDCADMGLTHEMVWSARDDVRHRKRPDGELAPFPRPRELAEAVAQHVRDKWPVISSVVGEHDGVPIVSNRPVSPLSQEWRDHCEALKARRDERTALALPEGTEREEARGRLERTLENLPVKRMKPARERAGFVEGEDAEALERRRAMVDQARQEA